MDLIEKRPYQQRVIQKSIEFFDLGHKSILIESPTGSGKTLMALLICKEMSEKHNIRWGWISMRRNLLKQAEKENKEKNINANIIFLSMFDKDPPEHLDGLVVDEAQHDSTDSCSHIHNLLQPKFILGLSATPYRLDRVKLVFEKVVKDAGIRALIHQGYLSQYQHFTIPSWSVDDVCNFYLNEPDRWGKTVIYFTRLEQCEHARKRILKHGIPAEVVSGSSDKEEQIASFELGITKVLINCMVLTEGFNSPSLNTVFVRPSNRGTTIQMSGRAFRKFPGKVANIIQSSDTKHPFTRTAKPLQSHLWKKDRWITIESNNKVELANQNVLSSLASIPVYLPSILTERKKKKKINSWD